MSYDKPGSRVVEEELTSRPGGARIIAGVIEGNPPPATVAYERQVSPRRGQYSAVHTPRGATLYGAQSMGAVEMNKKLITAGAVVVGAGVLWMLFGKKGR
jgi:hypothetical protein